MKLSTFDPGVMVRQLSAVVTHGVVALRNRGIKQTAIARQYNISQGEVSKILKRNVETGVSTPRPSPERPITTTKRQDRLLVRMCTGGRTRTTSSLRTEWQNAINVPISRTLVNSRLIKVGLRTRRPLMKPKLKRVDHQRRLQRARVHERWQPGH